MYWQRLGFAPRQAVLVLAAWAGLQVTAAAAATYTYFDVPGALETDPVSINDKGEIAGFYGTYGGARGFVRHSDGSFTLFDPKSSTETGPAGINGKGWVAGSFSKQDGVEPYHGFIRKPGGHTIRITSGSRNVWVRGINNLGDICGWIQGGARGHSFIRKADGTLVEFTPSGATGINDLGVVVGTALDRKDRSYGYLRTADGTIQRFDAPNAQGTITVAINESGWVTGWYTDIGDVGHAFLRDSQGTLVSFEPPVSYKFIGAADINDRGVIVGGYVDSAYASHAFIRRPDGKMVTLKIPASSSGSASGINNNGAIIGSYRGSDGVFHGFLRAP